MTLNNLISFDYKVEMVWVPYAFELKITFKVVLKKNMNFEA